MHTHTRKMLILGFATCWSLAGAALAVDKDAASESVPKAVQEWEMPSGALSALQKRHAVGMSAFVVQQELDGLIREGGGGACASAAGIDLLQALRIMEGLDPLSNPHQVVLSSFTDQQELLNGRVTNDQFVQLMDFYEPHLADRDVTVTIESGSDSPYSTVDDSWPLSEGPDLSITPRQLKLLSYTCLLYTSPSPRD